MSYFISKNRLGEFENYPHGWIEHLEEKNWVDMHAFKDAYSKALSIHAGSYKEIPDEYLLRNDLKI